MLLRCFISLATIVAAAPSPESLGSDLTILIDNDLQGKAQSAVSQLAKLTFPQGAASPAVNSSVIVLEARSYKDASTACEALGERLWSPANGSASLGANLNYLAYSQDTHSSRQYWVAPQGKINRAIDSSGHVSWPGPMSQLPVVCTQSAPFSNETAKDTSERWQVTVHSNNEYLTG